MELNVGLVVLGLSARTRNVATKSIGIAGLVLFLEEKRRELQPDRRDVAALQL